MVAYFRWAFVGADVDEAATFGDVLRDAGGAARYDAVILDAHLPDLKGSDDIVVFRLRASGTAVLLLTDNAGALALLHAFQHGVDGILCEQMSGPDTLVALHLVLSGQKYPAANISLPPDLAFGNQIIGGGPTNLLHGTTQVVQGFAS